MLTAYLTQTARLLQNPAASTALYSDADLTSYINTARGQMAGETECIRVNASLAITAAQRTYAFPTISLGVSGVSGVFNVRQASVLVGGGQTWMRPRPFEWFNLYMLNQVVPTTGQPTTWSQYAQGTTGSLFLYPLPDTDYTLTLDTSCFPIPLVDDTTVEAIPYPWTDAVPFFAAYYAYMSAQRQGDAETMLKRYKEFAGRARQMSNPSVLPFIYPSSGDPTLQAKLGMVSTGAGQGGGQ